MYPEEGARILDRKNWKRHHFSDRFQIAAACIKYRKAQLQCALDLTRALDGHLSCIDVAIMPRFMDDYVSSGGEALLIADEEAREARNRDRLERRLTAEDVPWSWSDRSGMLDESVEQALRLNDIVVVNAHLDHFPHREMAHNNRISNHFGS